MMRAISCDSTADLYRQFEVQDRRVATGSRTRASSVKRFWPRSSSGLGHFQTLSPGFGRGKDVFTGGALADSIDGGDGEDRLAAAGGNDTVHGAQNDSLLDGGTDNDWLKIGADFNDTSNAQIANFENV